jgi:cytohesin
VKGQTRDSLARLFDRETRLHKAAKAGDNQSTAHLLAEGARVDAKEEHWQTPLHLAATEGHKAVVELLLAKGADVHAKDAIGHTPSWWAAGQRHPELAEFLRRLEGGPAKGKQNFCPSCGAVITRDDEECIGCGRTINW